MVLQHFDGLILRKRALLTERCRQVPNAKGQEVLAKKYRIRLRFFLLRALLQ